MTKNKLSRTKKITISSKKKSVKSEVTIKKPKRRKQIFKTKQTFPDNEENPSAKIKQENISKPTQKTPINLNDAKANQEAIPTEIKSQDTTTALEKISQVPQQLPKDEKELPSSLIIKPENNSPPKKSSEIPAKKPEEPSEIKLTEAKIKTLLDVQHLEELFFLVNLLNDKQIEIFLQHYKKSEIPPSPDAKVDTIVKNSKNKLELVNSIKSELLESLKDSQDKIRQKVSELRKKGADVFIEDLKSLNIAQKIKLFNATAKKEDFYKIKKVHEEVSAELKSIEEKMPKKE